MKLTNNGTKSRIEKVDISIIILTRNPGPNFNKILSSIFSQRTDRKYEVLIIDSESAENLNKILVKFQIRLIRIKAKNFDHGSTRNYAAKLASGDFLVYLTQDALPADEFWLENLVSSMDTDETIAASYSRQIPLKGCNPVLAHEVKVRFGELSEIIDSNSLNGGKKGIPTSITFSDVSSCIRRSVIEKIRFRDGIIIGEDIEWAKRVLQAGYKIVYEAKSIVFHSHDYSLTSRYLFNFNFLCGFVYKQYKLTKPITLKEALLLLPLVSVYNDIKFTKSMEMSTFERIKVIGYSFIYHHIKRVSQFLGTHTNYVSASIVKKFYSQEREKKKC